MTYIHTTNGYYLGFINGQNLFSRDGEYLGWVEGEIIWGKDGEYRGKIMVINGNNYILRQTFSMNPLPRVPHVPPVPPVPPVPANNIAPIIVPLGYQDAYPINI